MTPVKFRGHNAVFGADQPEYKPHPARISEDKTEVTTVWELTDEEVELNAKTRKVKLTQLTFGEPLQPLMPGVLQEHDQY